ncbi:uncharacterized protein LOC116266724 [Nymphaea colorata]|nr:uncharacterized protein LOC116266724 [Nymphaea colorata]
MTADVSDFGIAEILVGLNSYTLTATLRTTGYIAPGLEFHGLWAKIFRNAATVSRKRDQIETEFHHNIETFREKFQMICTCLKSKPTQNVVFPPKSFKLTAVDMVSSAEQLLHCQKRGDTAEFVVIFLFLRNLFLLHQILVGLELPQQLGSAEQLMWSGTPSATWFSRATEEAYLSRRGRDLHCQNLWLYIFLFSQVEAEAKDPPARSQTTHKQQLGSAKQLKKQPKQKRKITMSEYFCFLEICFCYIRLCRSGTPSIKSTLTKEPPARKSNNAQRHKIFNRVQHPNFFSKEKIVHQGSAVNSSNIQKHAH